VFVVQVCKANLTGAGVPACHRQEIAKKRDDKMSKWLLGLEARCGRNRATVAYANKLARIAWPVIRTAKPFDLARAFR